MHDPTETSAPSAEPTIDPPTSFASLGLAPPLLKAIEALGFETPTPIQEKSIPPLLEGRDLIGQAQTGTGKTAAFGLPLLQRLRLDERAVQALVLVPTRELALQAAKALKDFGRALGDVRVLAVYGGAPIENQIRRLTRGVHIVVGTPGRVMDHLRRRTLKFDALRAVVLDEADEMLRMGFFEDVEWILQQAPPAETRQTALFSATLPPPIRRVASRYLDTPFIAEIAPEQPTIDSIEQRYLVVPGRYKVDTLCRLLETEDGDAALIFARTRMGCSELTETLVARGFRAEALHGDMSQAHRETVLHRFRTGRIRIVVATDVAARGLDVDGISHVVNFDMPEVPDTYIHRIGRTGRAGRSGVSILFVDPRERFKLRTIERFSRSRLTEIPPPTLADVAAHRVGLFKTTVLATMEAEDLTPYRKLVEEIASEGDHDLAAIAAAITRLSHQERPLLLDLPPEPEVRAAPEHPRPPDPRMVRLQIGIGAMAGVRPNDIVGAIANEAGVPGRVVGAIDIRERSTLVDVHPQAARQIVEKLAGTTIRGVGVRIRFALPERGDSEPPRPKSGTHRHAAQQRRRHREGPPPVGRPPRPKKKKKPPKRHKS